MKLIKVLKYKWLYGNCRHFCCLCKYRRDCYDPNMFVWLYHLEKAERAKMRDIAYYKKWKEKRNKRK